MNQDREKFLNLKDKPARLNVEETAWYLGFATHDIPILISNSLLKALGHPADNATKYFAFDIVEQHHHDAKWLAHATDAIMKHWKFKNARRKENTGRLSPQGNVSDQSGKTTMQGA
jgi:hypothetical protein